MAKPRSVSRAAGGPANGARGQAVILGRTELVMPADSVANLLPILDITAIPAAAAAEGSLKEIPATRAGKVKPFSLNPKWISLLRSWRRKAQKRRANALFSSKWIIEDLPALTIEGNLAAKEAVMWGIGHAVRHRA